METDRFRNALVGASVLMMILALGACKEKTPAQDAGKQIDQAMEKAADKAEKATDQASAKLKQGAEKAGEVIDDTTITAKVKAAILAEPGLKTLQINVETTKGVVVLSGSADSQKSSDRAKELAAAVAGVKSVDNRLVVKS